MKRDVIWNTVGSFLYALASMVLAVFVMRVAGDAAAGIFSIGFSTFGQQMFTVSYFGLRSLQITDGGGEQKGVYSFGEYLLHRKLTTALAVCFSVLYLGAMVWAGEYSFNKSLTILLLAGYKIVDGYADVYESEFQRQGRLYLTGKSNTFRTVLSVGVFAVSLIAVGNLSAAAGAALMAQLAGWFIFDFMVLNKLPGVDKARAKGQVKKLFRDGGLLFFSVFLDFYIFSSAKYAIDRVLGDSASGYFNFIFMPTSVIYLVANFIIRPYLTDLTVSWQAGKIREFKQKTGRLVKAVGIISIVMVAAACLLGPFALGTLERLLGARYQGSLVPYQGPLVMVVFGGGIYALANLMYYVLVILRRQKDIFLVYLTVSLLALWLSPVLVGRFNIPGGAAAYCLLMLLLLGGFGTCTIRQLGKRKEGVNEG